MSGVSKINKTLGKVNKHFCNKLVADSCRELYHEQKREKVCETVEITKKEQIFKNQKIELEFEGSKEDLSDLRLKVYVNGAMKYVSMEGAFIVSVSRIPRIVRKGWFFTTVFEERKYLKFKEQVEFDRFSKFTCMLRDCVRVNQMYSSECVRYVVANNLEATNLEPSRPL